MGRPDVCRGFFQGQIPAVDILRPVVTDSLFPFQVVFRHPFHGDDRVDKMLYLVFVVFCSFMVGIQRNKDQYGSHQGHICHNNP